MEEDAQQKLRRLWGRYDISCTENIFEACGWHATAVAFWRKVALYVARDSCTISGAPAHTPGAAHYSYSLVHGCQEEFIQVKWNS